MNLWTQGNVRNPDPRVKSFFDSQPLIFPKALPSQPTNHKTLHLPMDFFRSLPWDRSDTTDRAGAGQMPIYNSCP